MTFVSSTEHNCVSGFDSDSKEHVTDDYDQPATGALAIGCLVLGVLLALFVAFNDGLQRLSFAGGIVLLLTMSVFPMTVWLTFGRHHTLEASVISRRSRWEVRLVASLWVMYSFVMLLIVQRTLA